MNPLHFRTAEMHAAPATDNATELLRQHHYDPSVKDALLAAARAAAAKDVSTQQSTTTSPPQPPTPTEPPDDTPPNLHREIMIVPQFLNAEICDEYVEYCTRAPEIDLSVFDPEATNRSGALSWEVDKQTRDTQTVPIDPIKDAVLDLMRYAVRDYLNPFYNVTIKDSELPQLLIYHPGGHYKPHIDGEALFDDGSGQLKWVKNVDRDISMVIYLNDDYEGGQIVFPKQAVSVTPRKGMLIAFPSTHHFLHGVNPVLRGNRFAIVNWFSLGQPPVQQ